MICLTRLVFVRWKSINNFIFQQKNWPQLYTACCLPPDTHTHTHSSCFYLNDSSHCRKNNLIMGEEGELLFVLQHCCVMSAHTETAD